MSTLNSVNSHQRPAAQLGPTCRECGSPLSDASQFCWMCGATKGSQNDPRVHAKGNGGPPLVMPGQPTPAVDGSLALAPRQDEIYDLAPPPYWPPSLELGLLSEKRSYVTPPSPEDSKIFEIRERQAYLPPEPERESLINRFLRPGLAVAFFAALVIALGYWQGRNAVNLYEELKTQMAEEISSLKGDDVSAPVWREESSPTAKVSPDRRPAAKTPVRTSSESAPAEGSLPLRINVQGQSRRSSGPLPASDAGYTDDGSVLVGISQPWITSARLSPMAIQISPRESLALLLRRVPPVYPESARLSKVEGSVALKVLIRKDGLVGNVMPLSGDPRLVPAAMDCVRQWVYRPYYRNGTPMDVETIVMIDFSLVAQADATTGEDTTF